VSRENTPSPLIRAAGRGCVLLHPDKGGREVEGTETENEMPLVDKETTF